MIERLSIQNFKSIKDIKLDCKRINLFIGEPNVGKSNLLEAMTLFSEGGLKADLRFNQVSQLFFDFDTSRVIRLELSNYITEVKTKSDKLYIEIIEVSNDKPFMTKVLNSKGEMSTGTFSEAEIRSMPEIRSYKYKSHVIAVKNDSDSLMSPYGDNIGAVVMTNRDLRSQVQNLLEGIGYKLLLKPDDGTFAIYKEQDGYSIFFPLDLVSDTVKRMIFYLSAIESNKSSTILFEEPESNAFPYYIKYLAERIARFSDNQYFITTHNPYFFLNLIEKTPLDQLTVNLVEMDSYETKVRQLSKTGIEQALDLNVDVFLNFDKLLET